MARPRIGVLVCKIGDDMGSPGSLCVRCTWLWASMCCAFLVGGWYGVKSAEGGGSAPRWTALWAVVPLFGDGANSFLLDFAGWALYAPCDLGRVLTGWIAGCGLGVFVRSLREGDEIVGGRKCFPRAMRAGGVMLASGLGAAAYGCVAKKLPVVGLCLQEAGLLILLSHLIALIIASLAALNADRRLFGCIRVAVCVCLGCRN